MAAPRRAPSHQLLDAPLPALMFDAAGRVVAANGLAEGLLGCDGASLQGRTFSELFILGPGGVAGFATGIPRASSRSQRAALLAPGATSDVDITTVESQDEGGAPVVVCFANRRSREELFKRQLELTKRFASEIISVKPLGDVLMTVARLMVEAAGADHATITLRDETTEEFVVQHEYPPSTTCSLVGERIPIKGRPTQEAIVRQQQRVVAPDLTSHAIVIESPKVAELNARLGNRSMAILPMVCRGQVIGTISADSLTRERTFSGDELDMFETVANQAAAAIDNARSFELAERLRVLYTEASAAFSLEHVAGAILAGVRQFVVCTKASIQLIVDDRRVLLAGYGFQREHASPRLLGSIALDPIVSGIVRSRMMHVIPDTSKDEQWRPQPETRDVSSWVGIPLVASARPLALITLDHADAGFYDYLTKEDDPRRLALEHFAANAALELQEAYQFDAAQHHIQSVALIDRVAECVSRTLDSQSMLLDVARALVERRVCDHCVAFLVEKSDDVRRLVPVANVPAADGPECPTFVIPNDIVGPVSPTVAAAVSGQPVVVGNFVDPGQLARYLQSAELPAGTQSVLATPILSGDRVVGVLTASRRAANAFDVGMKALVQTLARHTGIGVDRNTGLALVTEIGQKVLRARGMAELLREIVSGAMQLTSSESGVIFTLNDDGVSLDEIFAPPGSELPAPRLRDEKGITRRVIREGKAVEIPDISQDPDVNPALKTRFRSMFAFPLVLSEPASGDGLPPKERVVGVLYLNGVEARGLRETERAFVTTLAAQAAIIIQRARLDAQWRESEALYRSLVDHLPQMVFRKDVNSRFTSVNRAFCASLGRSAAEILGETDFTFYPEEMARKFRIDDQRVMQSGESLETEEEHHVLGRPNRQWVRVIKTPVVDADGEVVGVQAIFWDVTEEHEHEQRYNALVDQSPDSIVLHRAGMITMANPAALQLFGVASEADLKGRRILDLLHPQDAAKAEARLHRLNRRESIDSGEVMRIRRGDEYVSVAAYARPLPAETEVQVVFHDLTTVNNLIREMHHRAGDVLKFVSMRILDEENKDPSPEAANVLDALSRRIRAMGELHHLLQHQHGARRVSMEAYLRKLATKVVTGYTSQCAVDLQVIADDIELDEERAVWVGLIVTELAANSVVHGFKGMARGRVSVCLARHAAAHELTVEDDGGGFPGGADPPDALSGMKLVGNLARQNLGGTFDVVALRPRGVCAYVRFSV